MKKVTDFNLKNHNTFAVDCRCDAFIEVANLHDLESLPTDLKFMDSLVLGGGSNILFTGDVHKTVIHIKPYNHIAHLDALVIAWAGTRWHDLVMWAVERNLGGVENLAYIPGLVGAAPIQNIGAYGAELKDVLVWVEVYNWQEQKYHRYSKEECLFGYRHSLFKCNDKTQIVTRVALDLRSNRPINLDYAELHDYFSGQTQKPSYREIAEAVTAIRKNKLPDVNETPNAGSFFKNPVITQTQLNRLLNRHPDLPHYPTNHKDRVKISAAWLLDQCGFKGLQSNDAGFSPKHALVLVNHGKATGQGLLHFAKRAKLIVKQKFEVMLEEEVRIV